MKCWILKLNFGKFEFFIALSGTFVESWNVKLYWMTLKIQLRTLSTLTKTSGRPRAQGMPQETNPTNSSFATRGPPLSPMQLQIEIKKLYRLSSACHWVDTYVPWPAEDVVQRLVSWMFFAVPVPSNRLRHSPLSIVLNWTHFKMFAGLPGSVVCPQPLAIAACPSPTKLEAKRTCITPISKLISWDVCTTDTLRWFFKFYSHFSNEVLSTYSKCMFCLLYEGWLTMLLTPYVVPPDKRECAPSTTIIVEGVLLTVLKDFFKFSMCLSFTEKIFTNEPQWQSNDD